MLHCKDHFVRNLDELTDAKFTEFGGNGNRTVGPEHGHEHAGEGVRNP